MALTLPIEAGYGALEARRGFAYVYLGCAVALLGVTYLERFGLVLDDRSEAPLSILTTGLALVFFFLSGRFWIDKARLALFCLAFVAVLASVFVALPLNYSTFSLLYLFVLYTPFVFIAELEREEYVAIVEIYQKLMIPLAVIAIVQLAMTMTGHVWWDFMDDLPRKFVLIGYNTHPPKAYGSPIIRANGEFFLEPSFLSQFMALGIILDLVYAERRRWWRMALFAAAIIASLSGTGVAMLIFFGLYAVLAQRRWELLLAMILAGAAIYLLRDQPLISDFLGRVDEFDTEHSSAFIRFVAPFAAIPDALGSRFIHWLGGIGLGEAKTIDLGGYVANPFVVSKLMIETGLIGCLPFVGFVTYAFFARTFSRAVTATLFLMYMLLSGSLQQPHTVYLFLILTILFVPPLEEGQPARRR